SYSPQIILGLTTKKASYNLSGLDHMRSPKHSKIQKTTRCSSPLVSRNYTTTSTHVSFARSCKTTCGSYPAKTYNLRHSTSRTLTLRTSSKLTTFVIADSTRNAKPKPLSV